VILFAFPFIKVLLDNVLSTFVELWVTLQVKLGNIVKNIISMVYIFPSLTCKVIHTFRRGVLGTI
jgi:hypothetical protein